MTLGDIVSGLITAITKFVAHFLEVFFWSISWWDANFVMILIVIWSYIYLLGFFVERYYKAKETLSEVFRFFTNSEYRNEYRKARSEDKLVNKAERDKDLAEAKEKLTRIGFLKYKFPIFSQFAACGDRPDEYDGWMLYDAENKHFAPRFID